MTNWTFHRVDSPKLPVHSSLQMPAFRRTPSSPPKSSEPLTHRSLSGSPFESRETVRKRTRTRIPRAAQGLGVEQESLRGLTVGEEQGTRHPPSRLDPLLDETQSPSFISPSSMCPIPSSRASSPYKVVFCKSSQKTRSKLVGAM